MRWIVPVLVVVAALAMAFLYFRWVSVLSSVIPVVSTPDPRQDAPAPSLAASQPDAPANISSELSPSAVLAIAATPSDNRQETKGSGAPDQVAQARIDSAPTSSTEAESGKKQVMELLDAVRVELASPGGAAFEMQGENRDSGVAETARTARRADAFFQQFEAQIKAAMEAMEANPPRIDQQSDAVAPENPDRRTRHRRRRH